MASTQQPSIITSEEHAQLLRNAKAAKDKAYCPYSHFRVGAAVLTTSGTIIQGCNVENASYPVGMCAERCCLGKAVVEGFGPGDFKALAVSTDVEPPAGENSESLRHVPSIHQRILPPNAPDHHVR
ncbi:MAG: hypothetical protein OHK93_002542 [Ramalina farinacea]|uniref:CMP/dCMP-type deaminase domain-containing protein n=1 Tax=Ramalina farinacea TaxID=258253 RepID=A0AA43QUW4_9LECA|nr:hypothetical protein [Ramalina farinacea]